MAKITHRYTDARNRYLARLTSSGMSADTLRIVGAALLRLERWLQAEGHGDPYVGQIDTDIIDAYFFGPTGVSARRISAVTHNNYRAYVTGFFKWCQRMRFVEENVMDTISRRRPDQPRPHLILSANEMLQAIEVTENPRNRAMIAVALTTGLRSIDIRKLTVGEVNLETGNLSTEIRKSRKRDVKPIPVELDRELRRWLAHYATLAGVTVRDMPNDWQLFPRMMYSGYAKKWAVSPRLELTRVSDIATATLAKMGLPTQGEGFHTFRRSAARAFFEAIQNTDVGRDRALLIVKGFLNHESTMMTELYLGLSHERDARDKILKGQSFLGALAAQEDNNVRYNLREVG